MQTIEVKEQQAVGNPHGDAVLRVLVVKTPRPTEETRVL